jgi:hypothetical protein
MTIDLSTVYDFYPVANKSCIWVSGDGGFNFVKYEDEGIREQPLPLPLFFQSQGRAWYDCLPGDIVIISEKFKSVLEVNNVSGWRTFAINLFDKGKKVINGYYWFIVMGKCGPLDRTKGEVVERDNIGNTGVYRVRIGTFFDNQTWDGSDIFRPEKTGCFFMTEKAKKIIEENGITNAAYTRITEMENMF